MPRNPVIGDRGKQVGVTIDASIDPAAFQDHAEVVHHDDVVVVLGPVNSTCDSHSPSSSRRS